MRSTTTLLAGALLLLWMPGAGPTQAQTVSSTDAEAAPRVLRGSAIKPKPAPKRTSRLANVEVASGDTFWTFDPARGRLIACEREYGINVGQTRIRCTRGQFSSRD